MKKSPPSNKIISQPIFYFLSVWVFLFPTCKCWTQEAENTMKKAKPSSMIVLKEASDGLFSEYYFYDDNGTLVKTMRHDQFESKHPIFKLNLPKSQNTKDDARFFEDLTNNATKRNNIEPKIDPGKKLSELRSLNKFGLIVKTPEKATAIIGHPTLDERPIISKPANQFLIKIETARVLDAFASETEDVSNTLLDCSYITIYDYTGNLFKEILVPDKLVSFASISDDGKFLICICYYSIV